MDRYMGGLEFDVIKGAPCLTRTPSQLHFLYPNLHYTLTRALYLI